MTNRHRRQPHKISYPKMDLMINSQNRHQRSSPTDWNPSSQETWYHMSAWERKEAAEVLQTVNATVGILYSFKTRQAPSKSPGGTAWTGPWAADKTHGLGSSHTVSLNHRKKASLIDIQKHTFPLLLLFFFCSLLCTDTRVCLRFLISRKSLKPSAQWNNERRKIVEYPSPSPMAKLLRLATWLPQPKPINQIGFSITNPVRGVLRRKESATWLKRQAKRFWADWLESPAHVVVGTLLCSFSFLNPWNLTLARLFARRSGGDAVWRGARSWTEPSERSGRPWTNLKRHFPNTYHLLQIHRWTSATGQSANANTP